MEKSIGSMSKDLPSEARKVNSSEESSWTFYFEDFLCNYAEPTTYSCGDETLSLVSDAASSSAAAAAAKKVMSDNNQASGFSVSRSYSKSLSFKKRKTGAIVDDALEDTASSPVNSPKVCYFNRMELRRRDKEHKDILKAKVGEGIQTDERRELSIVGRNTDFTELKKRGLCLVPVSTLANYLG